MVLTNKTFSNNFFIVRFLESAEGILWCNGYVFTDIFSFKLKVTGTFGIHRKNMLFFKCFNAQIVSNYT